KSRSRPRSRTPNENWLHLTGAEQIAKVVILAFLGRKKCSFLTQEKRPFLGYSSSSSRILTGHPNARKIGFFLGAEANKSKDEHDDYKDEDDSLISGSGFHGLSVTSNFGTGKARAALWWWAKKSKAIKRPWAASSLTYPATYSGSLLRVAAIQLWKSGVIGEATRNENRCSTVSYS